MTTKITIESDGEPDIELEVGSLSIEMHQDMLELHTMGEAVQMMPTGARSVTINASVIQGVVRGEKKTATEIGELVRVIRFGRKGA